MKGIMMKEIVNKLINIKKTISTMESCTGGALASSITDIEGASEILKFSAVTYSNEFKIKLTDKFEEEVIALFLKILSINIVFIVWKQLKK